MKKYVIVFTKFFSLSWIQAMQYRTNFLSWILIDFLWSWMDLIFTIVLISKTQVIGNWTMYQAVVVIGVFRVLAVLVWGWLFPSFSKFTSDVREGKLDLLLVKPIETQFSISIQKFSFSLLPSLFTGIVFMSYGLYMLHIDITLILLLQFFFVFVCSGILIYACYFFIISFALFAERINNIHHLFPSMYDGSRYPKEVYTGFVRSIVTTVVPISLMIATPSEILFSQESITTVMPVILFASIFLILGRIVWTNGLKKYSSASS